MSILSAARHTCLREKLQAAFPVRCTLCSSRRAALRLMSTAEHHFQPGWPDQLCCLQFPLPTGSMRQAYKLTVSAGLTRGQGMLGLSHIGITSSAHIFANHAAQRCFPFFWLRKSALRKSALRKIRGGSTWWAKRSFSHVAVWNLSQTAQSLLKPSLRGCHAYRDFTCCTTNLQHLSP